MNYREAWANGEIEAGTLVDAIEEQAREIERLKMNCLNLLQQLEDLKAQHEQDAQTIKVLQAMARQLKAEIEAKKWQADQN